MKAATDGRPISLSGVLAVAAGCAEHAVCWLVEHWRSHQAATAPGQATPGSSREERAPHERVLLLRQARWRLLL